MPEEELGAGSPAMSLAVIECISSYVTYAIVLDRSLARATSIMWLGGRVETRRNVS